MPPVRWKLMTAALCFLLAFSNAEPAKRVETISMTEDGWRPIVGNSRDPQYQDEITHYRNPSQTSETVKAETPKPPSPATSAPIPPPQSPPPKPTTKAAPQKNNQQNKGQIIYGGKAGPHTKHHHPSGQALKGTHGPHIPLSQKGHRGPPSSHYKHQIVASKGQGHSSGKRHNKPAIRGPTGPHRDELLSAAATSNIGSYSYFNQGPSSLKTRIVHPQSQIDYSGFGLPAPNSEVYHHFNNQPIQQYVFPKHPLQNDVYYTFQNQNDEYTRNLVPPPPYKAFSEKENKQKVKSFYKQKEPAVPVTEPILAVNDQITVKFKTNDKPALSETVEVPPPYVQQTHFGNQQQQQFAQSISGPTVDIQITKEKLNAFHNNIPTNYRPLEQYSEFGNHFAANQPNEAAKIQTYEVTEGKFWQENQPLIQQQQYSTRLQEPVVQQQYSTRLPEPAVQQQYPTRLPEPAVQQQFSTRLPEPVVQQQFSTRLPDFQIVEQQVFKQPVQQERQKTQRRPQQQQRIKQQQVFLEQQIQPIQQIQTIQQVQPVQKAQAIQQAQPVQKVQPVQQIQSIQQIVPVQQVPPLQVHFLPTPFLPDLTVPTLPTQSDVSTIYNEVSQINKQKSENPSGFNIKEVSTHFPIVGQPQYQEHYVYNNAQYASEAPTTIKTEEEIDSYVKEEEMITTPPPTEPPRTWQAQRNNNRRRRPVNRNRSTTTESVIAVATQAYEAQKDQSRESSQEDAPQPSRPQRRRPTRYRSTTEKPKDFSSGEEQPQNPRKRQRVRVRPTQQTIEEYPQNHKMTDDEDEDVRPQKQSNLSRNRDHYRPQQTTERQYHESLEEQYMESFQKLESGENSDERGHTKINLYDLSNPYEKPPNFYENKIRRPLPEPIEETTVVPSEDSYKSTTEVLPATNVHLPESETYQTTPNYIEPSFNTITIQEIYNPEPQTEETTLATTTTTTSTTTETPTTAKTTRSKIRLNKYDSNRPRFSVKDYKQRISQYSTTTTDKPSLSSSAPRIRLPNRFRRPVPAVVQQEPEEATEPSRSKFVPKDPRHKVNQESSDETTDEKQSKTSNSRSRPFGRFRSTTEAPSTTTKISIKPNLFANRRRPPSISLKTRILNKQKTVEETTTVSPDVTTIDNSENEVPKEADTTVTYSASEHDEVTTEFISRKVAEGDEPEVDVEPEFEAEESTEKAETEIPDILKNESFMYSQRVSDLTSSAKYDTPGLFKAVSPNSRRVPSYFTIATDDPILPIEAFFPNLKENKE